MMRKLINWAGVILFLTTIFNNQLPPINAQTFGTKPFTRCWQIETPTLQNISIASDNVKVLYLPFPEGIIKAIDSQSGAVVWQSEIGGEIYGFKMPTSDNLFVVSVSSAEKSDSAKELILTLLNPQTGLTIWRKNFKANPAAEKIFLNFEKFVVVTTDTGEIFEFDKSDGNLVSEKEFKTSFATPPVIKDENLYLGTAEKEIVKVSLSDNQSKLEKVTALENIPTAIFPLDNDLYIGDELGKFAKYSLRDNSFDWVSRTGAKITSITQAGDNLLVSSADNYVYLFSQKNGNRIWKKRFEGKNLSLPFVDPETAVFSPAGEKTATFVELKKGKTINQISLDAIEDNTFINSPSVIGSMVVFSTLRGFYAYSTAPCAETTTNRK